MYSICKRSSSHTISTSASPERIVSPPICRLRKAGRRVDFVLESKRMKWAFKHAERLTAERLVIIGKKEWEAGNVRVKNLATRDEGDVALGDLR
jgi:histidyl-tRNA synthetase